MDRLLVAWQESVFTLYLAEAKIEPEVAENMRSWEHSGFSVNQSVFLTAGDQAGIERLVQYMVRCPFSLSRLVKVPILGKWSTRRRSKRAEPFPNRKPTTLKQTRNGISRSSHHSISWRSSLSTFRPKALILSATMAGTPTSQGEYARRRKKRQRH